MDVTTFARAGLIQFGRFVQPDGQVWPVALHLRWLPSYPALLKQTAAGLAALLDGINADRILSTVDAIPLGVALSLYTERPLVYPYGEVRDYTAAFAIEGAYDTGHPTVLLADSLIDAAQAHSITTLARRVGLEIQAVLAVMDLGLGAREDLLASGYRVRCLVALGDNLAVLEANGWLTPAMRVIVQKWVEEHQHGHKTG